MLMHRVGGPGPAWGDDFTDQKAFGLDIIHHSKVPGFAGDRPIAAQGDVNILRWNKLVREMGCGRRRGNRHPASLDCSNGQGAVTADIDRIRGGAKHVMTTTKVIGTPGRGHIIGTAQGHHHTFPGSGRQTHLLPLVQPSNLQTRILPARYRLAVLDTQRNFPVSL